MKLALFFLLLMFLLLLGISCNNKVIVDPPETPPPVEFKIDGTIDTARYIQSGYFNVDANESNNSTLIAVSSSASDFTLAKNLWGINFKSLTSGTYTCAGTSPPDYGVIYNITPSNFYSSSTTNLTIIVSSYNKSVGGIIEGTASGKLQHIVDSVITESGIDFSLNFKVKITSIIP